MADLTGVADGLWWELLGLRPGDDRPTIRRAYRRKARENHPDFFPEEDKPLQEIKMIALNEAYAHLLSLAAKPSAETRPGSPGDRAPGSAGRRSGPPPREAMVDGAEAEGPRRAATAVGLHKDPGYAYYKQGFVHFSRAIHGIEALYQSIARHRGIHFRPRDDAFERFAGSLVELRRAHEYFTRVVRHFEGSIWRRDAQLKLSRIELFSGLYRRIIGNLTRGH